MDTTQIATALESASASVAAAAASIEQARQLVGPTAPATRVVRAGENLQEALDAAGALSIEPGAVFGGTYTVKSNTTLSGGRVVGATGPALLIPPGTHDVALRDLELGSTAREVVTIGENTDNQKTAAAAPARIVLTNVRIPTFRGKRGIAIHAQDVVLEDCQVLDLWDPAGADSQAVYIGNAPGRIKLRNCRLQAGSDVVLVGGEYPKIPDLVPEDIVVEQCILERPLAWRTDGVARKVKNIFELKTGRKVRVTNCRLSGCWVDGQQGEAFTLTPALDGSKSYPILRSGIVEDVIIDGCDVRNVGGGLNILGRAYQAYTPTPLRAVTVMGCNFIVNRATFGGRGQLLTAGNGPGDVAFLNNRVLCDGSSTVYYYSGSVADASGATVPGGKMALLRLDGNWIGILGAYGFMVEGYANASNWAAGLTTLTVVGNVFGGPVTMAKYLSDPTNKWLAPSDYQAALGLM